VLTSARRRYVLEQGDEAGKKISGAFVDDEWGQVKNTYGSLL